jgi:ribosomal protein S18 acetylase RimI-like enzyme
MKRNLPSISVSVKLHIVIKSPLDSLYRSDYNYDMITIREAREDELLKAGELWSDFMRFNGRFDNSFAIRDKAKDIFSKEMLEKFPTNDYRLAVADDGGKLVGFCFSYISRKPKYFKIQRFGFIGDLYVTPTHRRMGVGKDLVKDAMNFFAKHRVSQIELLVAVKNDTAIKFWESYGFNQLLTWMYKRI